MPHDVIREVFFSCERFSTNFTPERRVVRVRSHVVRKMFFSGVLFTANSTVMRGFSRMPHDVVHEVLFSCEGFFANLTPAETSFFVERQNLKDYKGK